MLIPGQRGLGMSSLLAGVAAIIACEVFEHLLTTTADKEPRNTREKRRRWW